jgi:NAD(P)H-dependent FMN reductase
MQDVIKTAVILGSNRPGRHCDGVASWLLNAIARTGRFDTDFIDPLALDLPAALSSGAPPSVLDLRRRIGQAEAFVVVTPEYNHGYPAPLKQLIDFASTEWHAKPVAFVSYGGLSGGIRAVEQLRCVFAELHAVTLRDAVAFPNASERFGADGVLIEPQRFERQAIAMLERLRWWAAALKAARGATPYPAAIA